MDIDKLKNWLMILSKFYGFGSSGLGGGGGSSVAPLTNVIFVDKNGTGTPDGSIAKPYTTIQSAVDSVPTATTYAESKRVYSIVISPDTYDEALTIDITGKRIILTSWGAWNLGEFDGATDWKPSGTLRDITITGDTASFSGIRCGLAITTYNQVGQRYSTHQSYINGCRISGAVIVKVSGGASLELDIQAEVFGNGGVAFGVNGDNGSANPILQIYVYNGRWKGTFNGGLSSNFQHAENVRFGGLLTTPNYSLIKACHFDSGGGMSVSGLSAGLFPQGIIDSYFAGGSTFTGTARINGNTNFWMKANGVVPTIKTIQDDTTP